MPTSFTPFSTTSALVTGVSGITWQEAWASRIKANLDGLEIQVIGKSELIRNKQATGRPQDFADVARLRQEKH
jgi:hypothetical protein